MTVDFNNRVCKECGETVGTMILTKGPDDTEKQWYCVGHGMVRLVGAVRRSNRPN